MAPAFGSVKGALGALLPLIPMASAVPVGLQIYQCTVPGVIAPGFDDGPWIYSEGVLDRMERANFKATWFINGANKGNIYDYNSTLQRMVNLGHQIGSHTWSHKDLATLSADGVKQEMTLLEQAMTNILGYFPYYMRPPFLSVNAQALKVLGDLDYHVIIGDLNTKDWEYQSETAINTAKKIFTDGLDMGYTIVEAHEQEPWTHGELVDFMIATVQNRSIKTVTVGECLGDSQWYRSVRELKPTNVSSSANAGPTVVYSLNGRCGNINAGNNMGWTCPPNGGRCCSKYGNCGSGDAYCAANVCQPAFGSCNAPLSTTSYHDEADNTPTGTGIPSRTVSDIIATSTSSKAIATSLGPGSITPDGTCGLQGNGKEKGYVCKAGQCCSKYGNCGATSDYCAATVCQSAFGICNAAPARGSVTPDGTCGDVGKGNNTGYVCKTGQCCSKYGNCGTTADYCDAAKGCQSAFGNCTGVISSMASANSLRPVPLSSDLIATSFKISVTAVSSRSMATLDAATSSQSSVAIASSSASEAALNAVIAASSTVTSTSSTPGAAPSSSSNAPQNIAVSSGSLTTALPNSTLAAVESHSSSDAAQRIAASSSSSIGASESTFTTASATDATSPSSLVVASSSSPSVDAVSLEASSSSLVVVSSSSAVVDAALLAASSSSSGVISSSTSVAVPAFSIDSIDDSATPNGSAVASRTPSTSPAPSSSSAQSTTPELNITLMTSSSLELSSSVMSGSSVILSISSSTITP